MMVLYRRPPVIMICVGVLVLVYLVVPSLIIVPMSFSSAPHLRFPPPGLSLRWYREIVNDPNWTASFLVSLRIALATTLVSVVLGTGGALGLARARMPSREGIRALLLSPLIVPHVIIGAAIYGLFVRVRIVGTESGLIFAHTILAVPVVMIAVMAALKAARQDLELAAMSLGATPVRTALRITIPLIKPGILSGAFFAFITSFDELILALFIGGVRSKTLPLKMWDGIRTEVNPALTAVSTILIVLSALVLMGAEYMQSRSDRRYR